MILFGPIEESPGHYGIIDPHLDVREVVEDAASTAKYLCGHHYVDAPDIEIETCKDDACCCSSRFDFQCAEIKPNGSMFRFFVTCCCKLTTLVLQITP